MRLMRGLVFALMCGAALACTNTVLRKGSRGECVKGLQRALGLSLVDGIFGSGTESAVKKFQSSKGLTADGIVGRNTWAKLNAASGSSSGSCPGSLGRICRGNSGNAIRGSDCQGSGAYGASRGSRKHKGIDVLCSAGDTVVAPFPGRISRITRPYTGTSRRCINNGLVLVGSGAWSGYSAKLWYVQPAKDVVGSRVSTGSVLGTHLGLHCYYSTCMTDHVHFQLETGGRAVNPTPCV